MSYYDYFQSIMNYGIISGGNSPYSINILGCKNVRLITGFKNKDSRCDLFRKMNIHNLQSKYIFSLLCSIITKLDQYNLKSDINGRNMRQNSNFHWTISNLTLSKRYLSYGPQDLQQFTGLHKGYISIKNSNYFKKKSSLFQTLNKPDEYFRYNNIQIWV